MMRLARQSAAALALLLAAAPAVAAPAGFDLEAYLAGARSNAVVRLGRSDCLALALSQNNAVRIKRLEPLLRADDLREARSDFEPALAVAGTFTDTTELSPNLIYGTNVSTLRQGLLSAGLGGRLWTGARYDLGLDLARQKSSSPTAIVNPAFAVEPQLTLTQPLLRGAGLAVNRAAIVIGQNNLAISRQALRDTAMQTVSRSLAAYYDLYYARTQETIESDTLASVRVLLEINEARYAKGLISSVDLLETRASLAERQKRLIAAEAATRMAEDALKLVTNLAEDPALWNARLEILETPELDLRPVDVAASLAQAFAHRADYQAKLLELANRDIHIQVNRNGLLPALDLVGSFGLNGLGEDWNQAVDNANPDYQDWLLGFRLNVPWGLGDRARLDRSKQEKIQALLALKSLEQDIIFEVRNQAREAEIQQRQTEAARLAAELETKNHDAQRERYAAGLVSTHDMLDYQNRLAAARLDYIRAVIDYQVALIRLDRAEGLILENNNITLEN